MKAIPLNKFSAGPLVLANSGNGVAIFTGYDLEPGEVRVSKVTIANTGSQAGNFQLFEVDPFQRLRSRRTYDHDQGG